jgi:hypothetical protein
MEGDSENEHSFGGAAENENFGDGGSEISGNYS